MQRRNSLGRLGLTVALGCCLSDSPLWAADDKAPAGWSTIKGQVVWAGKDVPKAVPLKVDKDQDHCLMKGPLLSEEFIVNKDNLGVKNVFVWLAPLPSKGREKARPLPIHPSLKEIKDKAGEMDQPFCQFV